MLQTDASDIGIGAVLNQVDEEEKDRPIRAISRPVSQSGNTDYK